MSGATHSFHRGKLLVSAIGTALGVRREILVAALGKSQACATLGETEAPIAIRWIVPAAGKGPDAAQNAW